MEILEKSLFFCFPYPVNKESDEVLFILSLLATLRSISKRRRNAIQPLARQTVLHA